MHVLAHLNKFLIRVVFRFAQRYHWLILKGNLILFLCEDGHWVAEKNARRDISCDIKLRGLRGINVTLSKVNDGTTPI